jgi:site-specific DNA-methyltransferase (adenine-specific)/adenine-specific DNA-methyltransferase
MQVQSELKAAGRPFRAFEVLILSRYERQAYLNISTRLSAKKMAPALAIARRGGCGCRIIPPMPGG